MKGFSRVLPLVAFSLLALAVPGLNAQDEVHTGTNQGNQRISLAAADFKPVGADPLTPALKTVFDSTLYGDLDRAGIFKMVAKSMQPTAMPGSPQEIQISQWSALPANASMVAFGALAANHGRLVVYGWLDDTHNAQNPQVLAKQYNEAANEEMARTVAHRFADEIIYRLGGGINGIAETKIYFVSSRSGSKEIWAMDYDGQNQHQVTHLGTISLSPRISPDGTRLAFASLGSGGWAIRMYSLELGRVIGFPAGVGGGSNLSPAWSADGSKIAFSSSRTGDPEIYVASANGGDLRRVTTFHGPDVAPTWNPKTNAQIAWVSGRTGLPQIYTMSEDGSGVQRITDGGYAVSPSWSPDGQFLAFSWNRKYGPGDPGGVDIHVIDLATKSYLQITHESGSNDFPSWAPDTRHIVFERTVGKRSDIWTMLSDGTDQRQLTHSGNNFMPNWSSK
ncbi:Tol-Pal system beta propeller repeat protein TolB [Telmatobacter bradus]|uniref:Tol-Pal system beta propeller repeat protein TolB n=1 Tax=Telmatobacter bradus TaxID=474953 RepID=UPI003B4393F6